MLVLIVILLTTSQVLAKYDSRFKDPIFPQYPNNMEGIPFRLGSMTPYHPPQSKVFNLYYIIIIYLKVICPISKLGFK